MLVLRVRKSDTRNQKSQTLHPFYHFHHLSDVLSLVERHPLRRPPREEDGRRVADDVHSPPRRVPALEVRLISNYFPSSKIPQERHQDGGLALRNLLPSFFTHDLYMMEIMIQT